MTRDDFERTAIPLLGKRVLITAGSKVEGGILKRVNSDMGTPMAILGPGSQMDRSKSSLNWRGSDMIVYAANIDLIEEAR